MNKAIAIKDVIQVQTEFVIDGQKVFETTCVDYDNYKELPNVVSYQNESYVKTGWSSDTNRACYKQSNIIAYKK